MAKTAMIRAKIDPTLKEEVEDILDKLGLSTTEAVNLFLHQIKLRKGIPFDIRIPNKITLKTFKDTDNGKNLIRCEDAEDMFKKLGI